MALGVVEPMAPGARHQKNFMLSHINSDIKKRPISKLKSARFSVRENALQFQLAHFLLECLCHILQPDEL